MNNYHVYESKRMGDNLTWTRIAKNISKERAEAIKALGERHGERLAVTRGELSHE